MKAERKHRIHALLKGIENGDEAAVAVVNPDRYIQYNPRSGDGVAALTSALSAHSTNRL